MTNSPLKIEYDNFCDVFKPQKNHLDDRYDGCIYETYGEELEYVRSQKPEHIWTIVESETMTIISSGYHLGNSIGYLICEKPIPEGFDFEIENDDLKKEFIISADTILHIAKDVLPDMQPEEAEDVYDAISDEIFNEARNAILYRLKELQAESEKEGGIICCLLTKNIISRFWLP